VIDAQPERSGMSVREAAVYVRTVRRETTVPVSVPFLDLAAIHAPLAAGITAGIADLIERSAFIDGPQVAEFEDGFARYCGTRWCTGVGSGLDALRLALLAAGIEPGDEVIVPANTFIATFEAVRQAGGIPTPVDVTAQDYNVDVDAMADAIGPRTAVLLPVHLYGQMADTRHVCDLSSAHGLCVIEDACQAHGARRDGMTAGAAGLAAAFSFYPGKNLGAMGDGGAVTTGDEQLAETVRALRQHGQRLKYVHDLEGYTARLDTIQAVVLVQKLASLDAWNSERRGIAKRYAEDLAGVGDLVLPSVPIGSEPVWHLYVVRTADPAALAASLRKRGIATARHYPQPPHLSRAFEWLNLPRGAFPITEALAEQLLSLPIFPGMTEAQLEAVVTAVRASFAGGTSGPRRARAGTHRA
jgi:dTDP-4-amino-4,6-dideoxygalactose transaminase